MSNGSQQPTINDNETTPLLPSPQTTSPNHHKQQPKPWTHKIYPIPIPSLKQTTLVPLLGILTVLFNEAEFHIKGSAQLRANEALICIDHYASLNDPIANLGRKIPELLCKSTEIQERVAAVQGAFYVVRMVCAIIGNLVLLWWFKAGRRRPVLVLHKVNLVVSNLLLIGAYLGYPSIPLWFMILPGTPSIFGGNFDLSTSTIFAAYADIIPDPTWRSSLIFITTSLQYAAQAFSLPLTGWLMNLDGQGGTPEVSFYVALACSLIALFINAFLFPETFKPEQSSSSVQQAKNGGAPGNGAVSNGDAQASIDPALPSRNPITAPSNDSNNNNKIDESNSKPLENPYRILIQEFGLARVVLLLIAALSAVTGSRVIDWYGLLQYPSIKFSWPISKTTWLICMQAVLSFVVFMVLIPTINRTCRVRYSVSDRRISVGITIVSSVIVLISAVVFGLPDITPGIFIGATAFYTLGSGVGSALQAYTVSIAPSARASGAALTVISLAATAGKIVASGIWPFFLAVGLEHPSHRLSGLPFFVICGFLVVVVVTICLAEWTYGTKKGEEERGGGGAAGNV